MRWLLAAMRPHQWGKNLLVVVAPLAGGRILADGVPLRLVGAFGFLALASSATYLVNDVLDRERDAAHPTKRERPIASGRLSVRVAVSAAVVLAATAIVGAALMGPVDFLVIVVAYLGMTTLYSSRLKHEPLLDIAIIAAGFLLRAAAGGVVTATPLSAWFLVTATFGALFIAAGKRTSELARVGSDDPDARPSLTGYTDAYLRFVWTLAATVAVSSAALWAIEVASQAARPVLAQLSIGPLALGVLRYGWWIERGEAESPEQVLRGDRVLLVIGVLWFALVLAGAGGPA